jgi:hypothetical protein
MVPKDVLRIMSDLLCDITQVNNIPFGHKVILCGGDFRQTLPIQPHATRAQLIDLTLKKSQLWPLFQQFRLVQNMRALPEERHFAEFILNVGNGTNVDNEKCITLPDECPIVPHNTNLGEEVFLNAINTAKNNGNWKPVSKRVILAPHNSVVDEWNDTVYEMMPTENERSYLSIDSAKKK